jgi:hypothetical protein
MELEKANEQVGEENKQFTKSKFWSCLKLQMRSLYIHICLDWNINLWLLWKVVYAVQITVLAIQNCLAKGQGLECCHQLQFHKLYDIILCLSDFEIFYTSVLSSSRGKKTLQEKVEMFFSDSTFANVRYCIVKCWTVGRRHLQWQQ